VSFDTGLEWRRIFHGRDVAQTREYLRRGFGQDVQFEPARSREPRIDVRSDGVGSTARRHSPCSPGKRVLDRGPSPRPQLRAPPSIEWLHRSHRLPVKHSLRPATRFDPLPPDSAGRHAAIRGRRDGAGAAPFSGRHGAAARRSLGRARGRLAGVRTHHGSRSWLRPRLCALPASCSDRFQTGEIAVEFDHGQRVRGFHHLEAPHVASAQFRHSPAAGRPATCTT
jgi:hypothetical protein